MKQPPRLDDWHAVLQSRDTESDKNWTAGFLLSLFLGCFGADRFYLDEPVLGFFKFFTFGGLLFWWFLDIALFLAGSIRDSQGAVVRRPF